MHAGGLAQQVPRAPLTTPELLERLAGFSATQKILHALEQNLVEERQAVQQLTFTVCKAILSPLHAAQCLLLVTKLQCSFEKLLTAILSC